MTATEQRPTHAMLVRTDTGLHLRYACTTRACAERSITFGEGGYVLGVTELYPEPIMGGRFWQQMQHGNTPMTAADMTTPPVRDARDDEISMLRDALDHIARSAHQSRSQTVRIRWIEARANGALEGKPYVRGQFREPKNGIAEFERMQSEILRMKAAQPVARVPLGMVMVPREPTEAMVNAPNTIIQTYGARLIWQRMIAAAPAIEADDVPDPTQAPTPASIVLSVTEIIELTEFAGLHFDESKLPPDEEREFEYTIAQGAPQGTTDDDGNVRHYAHVAWMAEYPEEGCYPLGPETGPSHD